MLPAPFGAAAHFGFELAAYAVGVRMFLRARAKSDHPLSDHPEGLWVLVGAVLGAAVGSKLLAWLQFPQYTRSLLATPALLLGGKSVVGGFLGGLVGVEWAKRRVGLTASTGDAFVSPLIAGTVLGRIGCFFAGLEDYTYGNPTSAFWGIDLGDGIARHPTTLYEIGFLAILAVGLQRLRPRFRRSGDRFRLFLSLYLAFRFAVEFLKPPHGGFPPALPSQPAAYLYLGSLTAIQLACLLGLAYYSRDLWRLCRELRWQEN